MNVEEITAHIEPIRHEYAEARSLILPALKFAQTEKGHLTREDLEAVAQATGFTAAYVESVASFYDRLYLRPTGERVVSVCVTLSCMLRGSDELLEHMCDREGLAHHGGTSEDGAITIQEAQCLGYCDRAPCVQVDAAGDAGAPVARRRRPPAGRAAQHPPPRAALEVGMPIENIVYRQRAAGKPLTQLADYRAANGYTALQKALTEMDRDEALYEFLRSGLRGRGGAGFPMGRKASFIPKESALAPYVVCNADESEPGTFKDREIMETNPFQLLEGIAIAGYAIGARRGYIYIRGEYEHQARVLDDAVRQALRGRRARRGDPGHRLRLRHHGLPGRRGVHLRRGDRAPREPGGQARPAAPQAALPGGGRPVRRAHAHQQRRDPLVAAPDRRARAPTGTRRWAPRRAPAPRCSRSRAT